jgi:hypothetical protein
MARPKETVEELEKQVKALSDKLREARAKEQKKHAEAIRRKAEIAGTLVLKNIEAEPNGALATAFRELLNTSLTKGAERALFDLPAVAKATHAKGAPKAAHG